MEQNSELLRYHIADTKDRLTKIESKVDALGDFKVATLTHASNHARTVSLLVSGAVGLITILVTAAVEYFLRNR